MKGVKGCTILSRRRVTAEVVSAGVSVLLIYILTGVLLYEAVQRTMQPDFNIDGDVMLITAAVGVAVNLM